MCPDYYHWRTGGGKHHKGGPHPNRLPKSVTKPRTVGELRPQGRTLAQALHYNAYLERDPMMAGRVEEVMATRIGGRQGPLVAGPRRVRRPRA